MKAKTAREGKQRLEDFTQHQQDFDDIYDLEAEEIDEAYRTMSKEEIADTFSLELHDVIGVLVADSELTVTMTKNDPREVVLGAELGSVRHANHDVRKRKNNFVSNADHQPKRDQYKDTNYYFTKHQDFSDEDWKMYLYWLEYLDGRRTMDSIAMETGKVSKDPDASYRTLIFKEFKDLEKKLNLTDNEKALVAYRKDSINQDIIFPKVGSKKFNPIYYFTIIEKDRIKENEFKISELDLMKILPVSKGLYEELESKFKVKHPVYHMETGRRKWLTAGIKEFGQKYFSDYILNKISPEDIAVRMFDDTRIEYNFDLDASFVKFKLLLYAKSLGLTDQQKADIRRAYKETELRKILHLPDESDDEEDSVDDIFYSDDTPEDVEAKEVISSVLNNLRSSDNSSDDINWKGIEEGFKALKGAIGEPEVEDTIESSSDDSDKEETIPYTSEAMKQIFDKTTHRFGKNSLVPELKNAKDFDNFEKSLECFFEEEGTKDKDFIVYFVVDTSSMDAILSGAALTTACTKKSIPLMIDYFNATSSTEIEVMANNPYGIDAEAVTLFQKVSKAYSTGETIGDIMRAKALYSVVITEYDYTGKFVADTFRIVSTTEDGIKRAFVQSVEYMLHSDKKLCAQISDSAIVEGCIKDTAYREFFYNFRHKE